MREFQLNTIFTDYHFKYPINENLNIRESGLRDTGHYNIYEYWTTMNQWIFRYLSVKNSKNIWEILYIKEYNYLLDDDIIHNDNTKIYHSNYFKYINIDIKYTIEYIEKNKKLNICDLLNTSNLNLGNIICKFVLKKLKENKVLDKNNNLIGNIKQYNI